MNDSALCRSARLDTPLRSLQCPGSEHPFGNPDLQPGFLSRPPPRVHLGKLDIEGHIHRPFVTSATSLGWFPVLATPVGAISGVIIDRKTKLSWGITP